MAFIFSDLSLSCRLEMAEAHANAMFVDTRARINPDSGARRIKAAGAYAMFDGTASPLTQTFGLGMHQMPTVADMQTIEDFYRELEAPVYHEVSPLAGLQVTALLNERGYHPMEFTSVMFQPISRDLQFNKARNEKIEVRLVEEDEHETWAQTSAKGWGEFAELADIVLDLARISVKRSDGLSFLAKLDGQPIATGGMSIFDGIALMAGASTIPEGRKQGAQLALLESRLRYAVEQGCDIAMMCTQPGSGSQRNAERQGFRIAYTRIKWRLGQSA